MHYLEICRSDTAAAMSNALNNQSLYDELKGQHTAFVQAAVAAKALLLPPPGTVKAEAGESALHAALAERDANAQTAKAMSKLHDEAEKEIEGLHATIASLAVKAEAGQGVSRLAALERVAAEARKLATLIPATSAHLDGLNAALAALDGMA